MEQEQLTTVHHALAEAATEVKPDEGPMGTYTFRVHDAKRVQAEELCAAHGTTLAEYLRKCIELLPRDYKP